MGVRLLPLWLLCVALAGCSPTATEQTTAYNCCPCCDCCRPPEPVPPVQPEPPPEVDTIFELSKLAAVKLGDAVTARRLAEAILPACDAAAVTIDMLEAIRVVQDAMRAVLIQRDGEADLVDWRNGWRAPISDLIGQRNPRTPAEYAELMRHAARGLMAAATELAQ